MYPGRRKMVKYPFTAEERADVIAFLGWVGKIDTNGFPAKPDMAPPVAVSAAPGAVDALAAAPATVETLCTACHAVGGRGGNVGPALDGVATRFGGDRARLDAWLRDPASVKPGTAMPNLGLAEDDRAAVVDWLLTLR